MGVNAPTVAVGDLLLAGGPQAASLESGTPDLYATSTRLVHSPFLEYHQGAKYGELWPALPEHSSSP